MRAAVHPFPLLLATLAVTGCDSDDESRPVLGPMTDSLGVRYEVVDERIVTDDAETDLPVCDDDRPMPDLDWGDTGIALMCAAANSPANSLPETCRPLVCDSDHDCPYLPHQSMYGRVDSRCIAGICQCVDGACPCVEDACPPSHPPGLVGRIELIALCLHDVPRRAFCGGLAPLSRDHQPMRDAVDMCDAADRDDDLCPLPDFCRQR